MSTNYYYNKYKAQKTEYNGIIFDSKKEARRYQELILLEKAGQIKDLKRQVEYELIPAQYLPTGEIYQKGPQKGKVKTKLVERKCSYIADFVYFDLVRNKQVVEDTKGFRSKDYLIKRKLMLYLLGIKVDEI